MSVRLVMSMDLKSSSLDMCLSSIDKPIMEQSYGQHLKLYKDSRYQNWRS